MKTALAAVGLILFAAIFGDATATVACAFALGVLFGAVFMARVRRQVKPWPPGKRRVDPRQAEHLASAVPFELAMHLHDRWDTLEPHELEAAERARDALCTLTEVGVVRLFRVER